MTVRLDQEHGFPAERMVQLCMKAGAGAGTGSINAGLKVLHLCWWLQPFSCKDVGAGVQKSVASFACYFRCDLAFLLSIHAGIPETVSIPIILRELGLAHGLKTTAA